MNKRIIALVLCALLTLTTCVLGEDIVGTYRISPESIEAFGEKNQEILALYPFTGSLMDSIWSAAMYEFDPEHNVYVHYEIPEISKMIQAFSTDLYAPADYTLSWRIEDGNLTLVLSSADAGEETLVLESNLDGDTLTASIEDEITLIFTRLSDTTGFEGAWQLDMDALYESFAEFFAQDDMVEAVQAYLQEMKSTFDNVQFRLYLNSDGTIGFGFDELVGSYGDGVIIAREQELSYLREDLFSTSTTYTMEGDTLMWTTTTEIFGISQVQTLILIRES